MAGFDPEKLAKLSEDHFGRKMGRLVIKLVLLGIVLGSAGGGLKLFFDDFVGDVLWPFFVRLLGGSTGALTLDSIEAVVATLTVTIVTLLVILIGVFLIFVRISIRRTVPQSVIDELAEMRSEGISILNVLPSKAGGYDFWKKRWQEWADNTTKRIGANFTKAEELSFRRLGIVPERRFGHAESGEHEHKLMQLAKQILILEDLINRYQERR